MGVDGAPLQVHGHACVDLSLKGHSYQADVVVVSPLTARLYEESQGKPWFREAPAKYRQASPIPIRQNPQTVAQVSSVCIKKSIKLPLYSEQVVVANVDGYNVSGTAIVEKLPGNPVPCATAWTLVEPCDGKVTVQLLNTKSEPVVMAWNVCVATIESVELPPKEVIANVPAKPAKSKQKE